MSQTKNFYFLEGFRARRLRKRLDAGNERLEIFWEGIDGDDMAKSLRKPLVGLSVDYRADFVPNLRGGKDRAI